jgi:ATP-dependent DNA helicase PIF1
LLCGDFHQLLSIARDGKRRFLFETQLWRDLGLAVVCLRQVHRQKEAVFLDLLQALRRGLCTSAHMDLLQQRAIPAAALTTSPPPASVTAIQPLAHPVAPEETKSELPRETWCESTSRFSSPPSVTTGSAAVAATAEAVHLFGRRADAQRENERYLDSLPGKRWTWRAQDNGHGDTDATLRDCPAEKTLVLKEGAAVVLLKNLDVEHGLANGSQGVVLRFEACGLQMYPYVRFACGTERLMGAETFEVRHDGELLGSRLQVPLLLACALTVHRAQGMTLDRVTVHVDSLWDPGHLYTAASRVRTLEGLTLCGFSKEDWHKRLVTHPTVLQFYTLVN